MKRIGLGGFAVLGIVALASVGRAQDGDTPRAYRGPHPMDLDGHWHEVERVHVHHRLSAAEEAYADVDGVQVFLGDPVAYGYTGTVWQYRDAHPLPHGTPAYCGIRGVHRHAFAPEGEFRSAGGVHRFVGALRGGYPIVRPGRVAPPRPVVSASRPPPGVTTSPGVAPFWYDGCLHRLVLGPSAEMVRVPVSGCVPLSRRRDRPAVRPTPRGTVASGRYGGFRTVPARPSPRGRPPTTQR